MGGVAELRGISMDNNNTLVSQVSQQTELKKRSNVIVQAIEKQKSSLFGFSDVVDLHRDKICQWELERKLDKIKSCASLLEWRKYGDEFRLHNANFCRQPDGCPVCAKRLQKRRVRRFKEPVTMAAKEFKYAYFVTFTVKNNSDLRSALHDLTSGLQKFRLQGQRRKSGRSGGQWSKVEAGLISIEIKRGSDSNLWHPHAHGLVFTNEKIDYRANKVITFNGKEVKASSLSLDWHRATGGRSINVDCRPVYGKKIEKQGKKVWRDVWDQSLEILKYNTKLIQKGEANAIDLATVLCASYGKRKFNTYGAFRDPESPFYCGELEPYIEDLPEGFTGISEIYSQRWMKGRYDKLYKERLPVLEEMKKTEWRGLAAQLQGRFKRYKYRLLKLRPWFVRHNKMKEFEYGLENCAMKKIIALKDERDEYYNSELSENQVAALLRRSYTKYQKLLSKEQIHREFFAGTSLAVP